MTGLLFVLSKLKIRYWLPWQQKYFTEACRYKYTFINCHCLIASTIDIKNLTPKFFTDNKILRQNNENNLEEKLVLMNIHEYANEIICIF